jgi:hypothetical protein
MKQQKHRFNTFIEKEKQNLFDFICKSVIVTFAGNDFTAVIKGSEF